MWLKLLLSGAIIAFCILLGYFASGKYRARKKFYSQFLSFNERYLTELCYARKPLAVFLNEYAYEGDFGKAVASFTEKRRLPQSLSYLTREESAYVADYFAMLGKGDSRSQNEFFRLQKGEIEAKKTGSESEAKSRTELYLKLGLLAGLAFVILIV